jgi:signal transduction histidine kinase
MARFNRKLQFGLNSRVPAEFSFQADAHRLSQAVTELIQNAVKATPDRGRVDVQLSLDQGPEGCRLSVTVCDTGVGIPPEEQQKILELFHGVGNQLHHHTSKFEFMGSGLGIGLTIVLEIAKAHGGGLDLSSQPGEGSVFTLWFPTR